MQKMSETAIFWAFSDNLQQNFFLLCHNKIYPSLFFSYFKSEKVHYCFERIQETAKKEPNELEILTDFHQCQPWGSNGTM